jgi:hypothetical protein
MRVIFLGTIMLLAAAGCEKTDPYFCRDNAGAAGCPGSDGAVIGSDMGDLDMGPDIDARLCYGAGAYTVCVQAPPLDAVTFTGSAPFDTSVTNTSCVTAAWTMATGQPDACFVVGTAITIPSLVVTGPRPLVLLSASMITISGFVDVAGHRADTGNRAGPGADPTACDVGTLPGGDVDGGGGGAGGSFMSMGGDGGDGRVNNNGVAGASEATAPTRLRGGCSGQAGATGQGAGAGGPRGPAGGGLYLIAATQITLGDGATINASGGGGGKPVTRESGAGGGGSGGMIIMNAPVIAGQGGGAFIVANGGGGGAGADDTTGGAVTGTFGSETDPTMPTTAAAGGNGPAGDGGAGATQAASAQPGGNGGTNNAGGGGGGGRGYIQSNVQPTGVSTSPTIVVVPNP